MKKTNESFGKSTLLGHLLYKCNLISQTQFEKNEIQARETNNEGLKYSYHISSLTVSDSHIFNIEGEDHSLDIWDTPGDKEYLKNIVTCISQSDFLILCIPVNMVDYDLPKMLISTAIAFGIYHVIIAISKMDSVQYSEGSFNDTRNIIKEKILNGFYKEDDVTFVPVSGLTGVNLNKQNDLMPYVMSWWNGPTLMDAMNKLQPPRRAINKPLRILVYDKFSIPKVGKIAVGKIINGTLSENQKIAFYGEYSENEVTTVKSLQIHHKPVQQAFAGDMVGIKIDKNIHFKRGMVAGDPLNDPPKCCKKFRAEIMIIKHCGGRSLNVGYCPIIDCGSSHAPCKVVQIISSINTKTKIKEDKPKYIIIRELCMVIFEVYKPFVIEEFSKNQKFGRFIIRDNNEIEGFGKVVEILKS